MYWIAIIVKLCPLEMRTAFLVGDISGMAHPKIFSKVFPLPRHYTQHTRDVAFALWCVLGVHVGPVVSVGNVDSLVPSYWVRIDRWRWGDAMFPFLLHLCVHHEQGVVRQVDRDLPFCIRVLWASGIFIFWQDSTDTKFSGYAQ